MVLSVAVVKLVTLLKQLKVLQLVTREAVVAAEYLLK